MKIEAQDLLVGDKLISIGDTANVGKVISVDFMERTIFNPPTIDVRFRLDDRRQFIKPARASIEIVNRDITKT